MNEIQIHVRNIHNNLDHNYKMKSSIINMNNLFSNLMFSFPIHKTKLKNIFFHYREKIFIVIEMKTNQLLNLCIL